MSRESAGAIRRRPWIGGLVAACMFACFGPLAVHASSNTYAAPASRPAFGDPCRLLPAALATPEGLVALGLQDNDVPGAQHIGTSTDANLKTATGVVPCATVSAEWLVALRPGSPTRLAVAEDLLSLPSVEEAHQEFLAGQALDGADETQEVLPALGIGDEDFLVRLRASSDGATDEPAMAQYLAAFRRGSVIVAVITANLDDATARADVARYAQLLDERVRAAYR